MREKDYIMEEVTYNHKLPARILHQKVTGPDCYVPLHWHREIELNLMLKGNTEFTVNGIPRRTMEGDLILINSGVLHLGAVPKGVPGFEANLELLTILWNYDFLLDFAEDISALEFNLDQNLDAKAEIQSMIAEIGQLYIKKNDTLKCELPLCC